VRYAQNMEQTAFFKEDSGNGATRRFREDMLGASAGAEEPSFDRSPAQTLPRWQERRIIRVGVTDVRFTSSAPSAVRTLEDG